MPLRNLFPPRPAWLSYTLAILPGLLLIYGGIVAAKRRNEANLSSTNLSVTVFKALIITAVLVFAVYYLEKGRGVPWMFAIFTLVVVCAEYALTRTKWGRSMFAIGGNAEAARRSGINTHARTRTYTHERTRTHTSGGASRLAPSPPPPPTPPHTHIP